MIIMPITVILRVLIRSQKANKTLPHKATGSLKAQTYFSTGSYPLDFLPLIACTFSTVRNVPRQSILLPFTGKRK